jgi:eukaryotic-like serine/threonine-protein kinase
MHALAGAGRVIGGRYRLRDRIGTGAMGTVWRATDELLHRDVAVKEVALPPAVSGPERDAVYQRTLREARTAARLSHPGVVTVFDVVEEDGRPWIVMELVQARSLDQVLAQDGPLSPARAAGIGQQLIGALATAHAAGVLHRDVKPSNVLLTPDGRAVLTDFGIATFEGDAQLTQTGIVMGTPAFTSPERIRGEPATPASDLWSLGATLFAAVQGRGPYQERGGALTTMNAVLNEDSPTAPAAGQLGPVISALMRKDPATRPDVAGAAALLAGAIAGGAPARGPAPASGAPGMGNGSAAQPGQSWAAGMPAEAAGFAVAAPTAWDQVAPPAEAWPPNGSAPVYNAPAWDQPHSGTQRPAPGYAGGRPQRPAPGYAAPGGTLYGPVSGAPPYLPRPTGPARNGYGPAIPGPAGPPPPRRGRSVALLAGAVAIVVVLVAIIGLVLHRARHPAPTVSGGQLGGNTTRSSPPASPSARHSSGPASTGTAGLPAGYQWFSLPAASSGASAGFKMAVPQGWTANTSGLTTYLRDPQGTAFMEADLTTQTFANPMTEARWLEVRTRHQGKFPGYRRLSLRPVQVAGAAGAEWNFSWLERGAGRVVAQDYLFDVATANGRQSYAVYASSPVLSWPRTSQMLAEAINTFQPLP